MGRAALLRALAAGVLLAAGLAGPGRAQALQPLTEDAAIAPWKGVGRLAIGQRGSCSAVLVEERIVLTAAHCLYDRKTHKLATPEELTFYAGLRNGRYAAKGVGRRLVVHPEYRYDESLNDRQRYGYDLAIIETEAPVQGNGVHPFGLSTAFFKGDPVSVVSYARGRNEYPSLQQGCMTELRTRREAEFACDVDLGASGAPVFVDGPGGPRIVSIVSAVLTRGDDKLALGAVLGHSLPLLMEELQRTSPGGKRTAPGVAKRTTAGFSRPPEK